MALQFIIGRAGAGKSHLLYEKMISESEKDKNKNYITVVPEQYSLETQKEILTLHPRHGSFNIEVTSFTRLAYAVLEEQGISGYKVMDDLGKTLVMRKVLEDCKKDLVIYKSKASMPGFAEKMKTVVSELKQYSISEAGIDEMIKETKSRASLKHKLNDIKVIYQAFCEYTKSRMITAEDVLNIFCEHIPVSDMIKNTKIYIDGFTGFTPIQYEVLELLIKHSAGVTVAITLPDEEKDFKEYNKYELFSLSKETIVKMKALADRNNVKTEETIVAGENKPPYRIRENEVLCFLEKNIFRNAKHIGECTFNDEIEIHSVSNPHSEAEFVAKKISSLVIERGYRYNDIAVITGDMEGYHRYIEEEFEKYDIPKFIDYKRNIASNPFVDGIKAVLEIIEKDFSYETVFHMVRLDFLNIARNKADIMENYVLQSGRRGYRSYCKVWEKQYRGMEKEQLDIVNEVREVIVNAVAPLREAVKKKGCTVFDYSKAVYQFMLSMDMQEKLNEYAKKFHAENMLSEAKEYEQAYPTMISLLDKIVSLMGDETITLKEYKQILQAGFENVKVGIIPPGLDTVMVGDIERTRLKDTKKIIFFMGVNDGIVPSGETKGGIITDFDREFLEAKDFILAPTMRENVFKQRVYLYSLLAKPTEKICISYSKSASDGSVKRKSYLINTLLNIFPMLKISDEDEADGSIEHITVKTEALKYTAENMREYRFKQDNESFEQLSAILLKDDECRELIKLMAEGAFYTAKKPELKKEIAGRLYGIKENIGITRLEKFAACAYAQFLNNGLKLGERKKFEIAAFDIGNLYHDAISRYFTQVQNEGIDWNVLEDNKSHEIMNRCVEKVMEEYDNDAIHNVARTLFIKNQVRQTATKTADVLVKHIRAGKFTPAEYELRADHGRIDRVDTLKADDTIYVKVIDYKSGSKKFSISDTFLGLQMQLMVYLKDAVEYEKKKNPGMKVVPAAGLYFHVHNPYIAKPDYDKIIADYREDNPESDIDDETIIFRAVEHEKYKTYKMSGLVNSETEIISQMDRNIWEQSGKSDILPVQLKQNGSLTASSMVMNSKDYSDFIDYVADNADKMKEQIMDGTIDINPVPGACERCPYNSVCGFDRKLGDKYREVEKVSMKYVIDKLHSCENEPAGE